MVDGALDLGETRGKNSRSDLISQLEKGRKVLRKMVKISGFVFFLWFFSGKVICGSDCGLEMFVRFNSLGVSHTLDKST